MGRRSYFSADKARKLLNWQPTVTYEVGVPMTVKWYLEQAGADGSVARPAAAGAAS
jgi:nucleoside-diphosphate-sugar epimerase